MPVLFFLLSTVGFLTGLSVGLFTLLVLGIRQGDKAKRLTGTPGTSAELLARPRADRLTRLSVRRQGR